jgi:myosin heavy subunit
MNLVGKIFVVLIFVMSLVFMTISMFVYAAHRNYREEILRTKEEVVPGKELGLKLQLDAARKNHDKLTADYDTLKKELDAEKTFRTQAVAKLENELKVLTEERKDREAKYAELVKSEREAAAAMKTTQENMTHSEKERDDLDTKVVQAQKDRDDHFKEMRRLTDELHQASMEKDQLEKRMTTLTADLQKAKEALQHVGVDPNSNYKDKTPPLINGGMVLAVTGEGYVEISVGSDAGLHVGHQLEVYRTTGGSSQYVGRIEVTKTTPDKSVCKINPKFQNSNMIRGDRVVSKIE